MEWLDTWLKTYASTKLKQTTYESYFVIVESHLKKALGHHKLNDLKTHHIQAMINDKLSKGHLKTKGGLSPRRVKYITCVLHAALKQACKNQLISRNPADYIDLPQCYRPEFNPWTVEETNRFLTYLKKTKHRLYPLFLLAIMSGCRRSELLGLTWDCVDFEGNGILINKTLVSVKGGQIFQKPKTKKSNRSIALSQAVMDELKAWQKTQQAECRSSVVFTNPIGQPIKPDYVTRCFNHELELAGLRKIRFHDLRHGHASMLFELGEDLKVIGERLGHASITVTGDIYTHIREDAQQRAVAKLGQVIRV